MSEACRQCVKTPFRVIFGWSSSEEEIEAESPREQRFPDSARSSAFDPFLFKGRTTLATERKVDEWLPVVKPRGRELYPRLDILRLVLHDILECVDSREDPVMGASSQCVLWHGSYGSQNGVAVVAMRSPETGAKIDQSTYVLRLLAMLFLDDYILSRLKELPNEIHTARESPRNYGVSPRNHEVSPPNRGVSPRVLSPQTPERIKPIEVDSPRYVEGRARQPGETPPLATQCHNPRCVNIRHLVYDL